MKVPTSANTNQPQGRKQINPAYLLMALAQMQKNAKARAALTTTKPPKAPTKADTDGTV